MFCSFKSSLICKIDLQLYSKLLKPPFSHLISVAPQGEQGLTMTEARVKLFRNIMVVKARKKVEEGVEKLKSLPELLLPSAKHVRYVATALL